MADTRAAPDAPMARQSGALARQLGLSTASALLAVLALWEGYSRTSYRDTGGVLTICWGDTQGVGPADRVSHAECLARLEAQAFRHIEPVLRCTPGLAGRQDLIVAAGSLTYNIGANAYCRSTVARRFNSGDLRGACDAVLMWVRVNGRTVRGLVNRRRFERQLCLRALEGSTS